MAETNDELLARWRTVLASVRAYDGQALDPVDRQTLNELRRQLANAEEEIDRRELRSIAVRPESGWQPLALHGASAAPETGPVELTWEKKQTPTPELKVLELARSLTWRGSPAPDPLEYGQALVEEFRRERTRQMKRFDHLTPVLCTRPPPYTPHLDDGLTDDQRTLLVRLAVQPSATARELIETPELERALEHLRLPRPYPLVSEVEGQLALTSAGRSMIEPGDDGPRVSGAFFPNLLVNGCAQPHSFPVYGFTAVLNVLRLLTAEVAYSQNALARTLGWPRGTSTPLHRGRVEPHPPFEDGSGVYAVFVTPERFGDRLEFRYGAPEAAVYALDRLTPARDRGEFAEGVSFDLERSSVLVARLPKGTFGLAIVRRLLLDSALCTRWQLELRVIDRGQPRIAGTHQLVNRFLASCRARAERILRATRSPAQVRRDLLRALLRAVSDPHIAELIDTSDSKADAVKRLTELDPEPFTAEHAQAIVQTDGLNKKRRFHELELESLEAELAKIDPSLGRNEIDRVVIAEVERVAALVGPGVDVG